VGKKGFTLLELVVVIGLLGLMLVMTVPRFRQALMTNELKASTRKIVGLVRGVRDKAIRDHSAYLLHIEIGANRFWVTADGSSAEKITLAKDNAFRLPAEVRVLDVWLRSRGKLTAGEAIIRCSRKGYLEQSIIHLGAEGGDRMSLLLTPFLGEIRTYEGYHEIEPAG
jgi:general secretion pathway protein H